MSESDPTLDWAQGLIVLGEQNRREGNLAEAIKQFDEVLDLPLDAGPERNLLRYHAYACRGAAHRQMGDNNAAIDDLSQAIAIDPERALAYVNRGQVWESEGEDDQAMDDYSRAIRLEHDHADAYSLRSEIWKRRGDMNRAIEDGDAARNLRADDEL